MSKPIDRLDLSLKNLVKFHAYAVTIAFVSYMFVVLVTGTIDFYSDLFQMAQGTLSDEDRVNMGTQVLRNLAFTIILYKGFTVLFSYAKTTHINTKLVLELAIIAPVIELIFNFHYLAVNERIIYAAFAVGIAFVYLLFWDKVKEIGEAYDEHKPVV